MTYFVEFLALQAGWFAAVLGAKHGWPLLGPVVCAVLVVRQLYGAPNRGALLWAATLVATGGFVLDTGLRAAGLVAYPFPDPLPGPFAPLWIAGLWALFGALLGSSLSWLARRPWLAVLLGAIGGPFSFWSASRLDSTILTGPWSLPALALGWGVATPLAARLVNRIASPQPSAS